MKQNNMDKVYITPHFTIDLSNNATLDKSNSKHSEICCTNPPPQELEVSMLIQSGYHVIIFFQ